MPYDIHAEYADLVDMKCPECDGALRRVFILGSTPGLGTFAMACLWCSDPRTQALQTQIRHLRLEKGYMNLSLPEIRYDKSDKAS